MSKASKLHICIHTIAIVIVVHGWICFFFKLNCNLMVDTRNPNPRLIVHYFPLQVITSDYINGSLTIGVVVWTYWCKAKKCHVSDIKKTLQWVWTKPTSRIRYQYLHMTLLYIKFPWQTMAFSWKALISNIAC